MLRLFALITSLAVSACASSGATPQPFPTGPSVPPGSPPEAAAPSHASGYALAGTALTLRGTPYRNGGADPSGFDCSGFVSYVFGQHGYAVPRSVGELFRAGREVAADAVEPGDLLFFNTNGTGASHVGIAIGGDQFIHAPSTSGVVRVESMSGSYWAPRFVGARRVN